jgi:hypothetical protein
VAIPPATISYWWHWHCGGRGKIYFDLEPDLGESEILGYSVGLRWRIGSSSFFASVEMLAKLYGGGFGKCVPWVLCRAEGKENDASDMESLFVFSSGWFDRFCRRNRVVLRRMTRVVSKNVSILKAKKSLRSVLKLVGSDVARGLQPIHTLVPSICTAGFSSDGRGYSAPTAPLSNGIAYGYDNQPGRDSHSLSFCCGHDL